MSPDNRDLTIDAVLSDPLIRAVMRADGVVVPEFETMLRSAARRLAAPPRRPAPVAPPRACSPALLRCFA